MIKNISVSSLFAGGMLLMSIGAGIGLNYGRREGVEVARWFVAKYEPDAYKRLNDILSNYKRQ